MIDIIMNPWLNNTFELSNTIYFKITYIIQILVTKLSVVYIELKWGTYEKC